jgi:hypothetical protein
MLSCVGTGLCDGLITRPEESYRVCLTLCDKETSKEEAKARFGLQSHWMDGRMEFRGPTDDTQFPRIIHGVEAKTGCFIERHWENKVVSTAVTRLSCMLTWSRPINLIKINSFPVSPDWRRSFWFVDVVLSTTDDLKITSLLAYDAVRFRKADRLFRDAYCVHDQVYDGGNTHLWNVGLLLCDYTEPYHRRMSSSNHQLCLTQSLRRRRNPIGSRGWNISWS